MKLKFSGVFFGLFRYFSYLVVFLIVSLFLLFCFVRFFEGKDKSCLDYESTLGLPERCVGEFKRDAEVGSFHANYMLFLISIESGDDRQARFWVDRMFHLRPDATLYALLGYCGAGSLFSRDELLALWLKMPKERQERIPESEIRKYCQ
ncbi:MAG: hypothetical protein ACK4F8_15250 [Aquabacterium sp.]